MQLFDTIFQLLIIGLVLLGCISFTMFIRRLLINATYKNQRLYNIEKKLDELLDRMENDKVSK
jgi:hypothetical protein